MPRLSLADSKLRQENPKEYYKRFYQPEPNTGCWLWTGASTVKGYACMGTYGTNHTGVGHRYMYELYKGPIPVGLQLDHLCRVKCCVNPDHLEVVTNLENGHRQSRLGFIPEQYQEIYQLHLQGEKTYMIANKFKISWEATKYIIKFFQLGNRSV